MKLVLVCAAAACALTGATVASPLPSPGSQIAVLGTIDESTMGLAPTVYEFSFSQIMLQANTRYWIGISSDDNGSAWDWSHDISGPGVAGEYFHGNGQTFPNSDGPYLMTVTDGTVVAYDNLSASIDDADPTSLGLFDSFSTPNYLYGFNDLKVMLQNDHAGNGTTTVALYANVADAPEPLTIALFGAGLAGLGALRRRKK